MSKKTGLISFSLMITMIMSNLVSASWYRDSSFFSGTSETIIQWTKDIFGPFFEAILGTGQFDEFFWAKILLLILLYAICYLALKNIEIFRDKEKIVGLVAIIISIFAVRFMDNEGFISFILMPSGALGISLMIFFPIMIFFFFIHNSGLDSIGRRGGWIVFFVVFLVLWLKRAESMNAAGISDLNWIYGIGAIIVFLNVLFDKKIHEYFGLSQARQATRDQIRLQIAEVEQHIRALRHNNPTPNPNDKKILERLEKQRQRLYRRL